MAVEAECVVVAISDEGCGFVLAGVDNGPRGLGLVGMRERATMIGGRIVVDSTPGVGTTVRVVVPRKPENPNA
jgi:signal transduction histidine kinase